ncbi:MAG: apolipoprotein N-acyltransferase [Sphaerochaetaceae bacterium]|jgi:apolipoprotein N-acyltransferase
MSGRKVRNLGFFAGPALLALSAILASLAFPNPVSEKGWSYLAFISLVPMFFVVDKASWKSIWLDGFVYGFVFYLVYNYWLKTFHPLAILIAPILESLQYLLLLPLLKAANSLYRRRGYLAQTVCYVGYLYLTQQGFLGYPYGNISAALWNRPLLIQTASIFGIWGICLMLVLPQTFVAQRLAKRQDGQLRTFRTDGIVYGTLALACLAFGAVTLHWYDTAEPERTMRIATVQHSADSWKGGYATYERNFETLSSLTLEAMEESPDMVVWSETAFVPSVAWHTAYPSNAMASKLCDRFVDFGKGLSVPLVTGNPEGLIKDETIPAILPDGSWNWKTYNTVILFGEGDILGTYRKQRLVPFTEHFPYEKQFPWLYRLLLANDYKWWEKGTEATVFGWDGLAFSTPICFEDTFGYLNAAFVRNGADLLMNLTNDSWSGAVAAQMQHMQLSVFRAVENRRPLLRSTNSGMTCLVLPSGRVIDIQEPFTESWHIYDVPIGQREGLTFYTEHPDFLGKVCLFLSPVTLLAGAIATVRRRKASRIEALYVRYEGLFEKMDERCEC